MSQHDLLPSSSAEERCNCSYWVELQQIPSLAPLAEFDALKKTRTKTKDNGKNEWP